MKVIIASSEITGVPSEVKILPMGLVQSQKGNFIVDEESFNNIQNTFKGRGIDIVIDYEHQTLKDVEAPAGGWIKEIFIQDGAIVAKVEWTPKAEEYLKNKEYKYLSPVVLVGKVSNKAKVLHSVALTNTPAIDGMYPIINSLGIEFEEGGNGQMEFMKAIAKLLGLPETATEEEVTAAVTKMLAGGGGSEQVLVANKIITDLLGVQPDAKTEDVSAAIMALKNPTGFVPAAQFNELKQRLDKKDGEELVENALKAGKITAAQKEWAEEYALKDPKGFAQFVEKSPKIVPTGVLDIDDPNNKQSIDDATMQVCKMMGMSKEDLDKYGKVSEQ